MMNSDNYTVRLLEEGDEKVLDSFLSRYPSSSMFLRSSLEEVGLALSTHPFRAEYVGCFENNTKLIGVVGYGAATNLFLQSPDITVLKKCLVFLKNFDQVGTKGLLGPPTQVSEAIKFLKIQDDICSVNHEEKLYELPLEKLIVPASNCIMKPAKECDDDLLFNWLKSYDIEALGTKETPQFDEGVRIYMDFIKKGHKKAWVLYDGDEPVSLSAFNARVKDSVQIGPVWTPIEHRSKGYARTLVAKTLEAEMQEHNIKQAILFTNAPAAMKAYEAIGFEHKDYYQLCLFKDSFILRRDQ